jgi:hypothetical protein
MQRQTAEDNRVERVGAVLAAELSFGQAAVDAVPRLVDTALVRRVGHAQFLDHLDEAFIVAVLAQQQRHACFIEGEEVSAASHGQNSSAKPA